ncbi:EAL domain protein [Sphingobium yanoikuyae]|uniref:EAL domain protein n=1 Tax=Sphingobium yanoikuyae TaxID=13690 RepID=A0A084ENB0_SPHYA|nr:EAL domain-containing protein [Sphingobium yanoikuyae]KEZ19452.1 EAL domain protein [Sphingobium yanoikuyae]
MVQVMQNREGNGGFAGNVHLLRRRKRISDSEAVHFSIRIENYVHIRRAYGEDGGRRALAGIHRLLTDMFREDGVEVVEASGEIDLLVWNLEELGGGVLSDACRKWLNGFCWLVPLLSFETTGGLIHLCISGRWEIPDALMQAGMFETGKSGACNLGFCGSWPDDRSDWSDRYRSDMGLVTDLLSGIMSGASDNRRPRELALAWQSVCNADGGDGVLYREALVRLLDNDGNAHSPGDVFLALERLGFVRVVDHYVVSRVIDELEGAPDVVLAANISARSVRSDVWWDEVRVRLVAMPDVARRLVLEITETADLPGVSEAVRFVTGMRRLGCRIALDDFGTGYASIRQLLAFSPDFVKIDRFFVRRAVFTGADRDLLTHLIGVGQSLGAIVIVEGVETAEQAGIVLAAGGHWQQGYHWGRPSLLRSWRRASGGQAFGDVTATDLGTAFPHSSWSR